MPYRAQIAYAAADALSAVADPGSSLVGFDGFVDSIIHMVDTRHDMGPTGYTRLNTIAAFAARCAAASGRSTNIEKVLIEERFGGNGPLMAGALARLGSSTTYIGAVGDGQGGVHPMFRGFASQCREVAALGPPSHTDCLEFDDGKLMLNNTAAVQAMTWDLIVRRVGLPKLRAILDEARLLGIVNWSLQGGVPGIWRGLLRDVFPHVPGKNWRLFIDLSDPAKRNDQDIAMALSQLRELEAAPGVSVTLGLNLAESQRIAAVTGTRAVDSHAMTTLGASVRAAATALRESVGLDTVVIHPREGAAAANASGDSCWFDGPFTAAPKLSTGAGDHFNAGFAFAQVHGLPLEQCLACGCAVSGAYVRDAQSPSTPRLVGFLRDLPGPE